MVTFPKTALYILVDLFFLPFVVLSGLILRLYRKFGSQRLPRNTQCLKSIGLFPIRRHFYEPLFDDSELSTPLSEERFLPGIDFREREQIDFLKQLNFQAEFEDFLNSQNSLFPINPFRIDNGSFGPGDAEFLFNIIRYIKPSRVIEIGCGSSTKIINYALTLNKVNSGNRSRHTAIEPFGNSWIEHVAEISLIRDKLERVDISMFRELSANDLLFIDSSHMIRPQGDVLREYLEIIPSLQPGVFVHVHDIFSPRDYPDDWVRNKVQFWNEQYLLEATLSSNSTYRVKAALNFLKHSHYELLSAVCPHLSKENEPGSFYFVTC